MKQNTNVKLGSTKLLEDLKEEDDDSLEQEMNKFEKEMQQPSPRKSSILSKLPYTSTQM